MTPARTLSLGICSEKIQKLYQILIFSLYGPKIGVKAGARTGARTGATYFSL
jgi:hypothetical protein